jgi:uncharacterized damage-inducible protein DinB
MTLEDLKILLDFHCWARDRVLEAAATLTPEQFTRDMGSSFKSVRDTLVHLFSADLGWYGLWQGIGPAPAPPFDRFPDIDAVRDPWTAHESKMRAFLNSLQDEDVNRAVQFRRSDGSTGSFPLGLMVQHVVNHGSYHRGQLTTLFRQLGVEPPDTMDLIKFYIERSVTAGTSRR